MTDKDKIKFAIRYLKQGLKSKRTPPLYEELMNELGFVKNVKSESCCQRCALPNDLVGSAWCTQHCQHDNRFKSNKEFAELNKEIAELEAYNEKLLDGDIEKHNKIVELQKENAELEKQRFSLRNERNTFLTQNEQYEKDLINSNENLTKAKEIIKRLIKETYGEGWNYSLQVKVEAEKFLKECE